MSSKLEKVTEAEARSQQSPHPVHLQEGEEEEGEWESVGEKEGEG